VLANSRVKFFNPPNKSFSANSSGGQVAAVEDRSGAEAVNGLCDRFRGLVDHEHRLGSVVSVRLSKTWCALADTDSHLSCLLSLGGNQVSSVFSSTTALPGPEVPRGSTKVTPAAVAGHALGTPGLSGHPNPC
jgi:hypothetical protein